MMISYHDIRTEVTRMIHHCVGPYVKMFQHILSNWDISNSIHFQHIICYTKQNASSNVTYIYIYISCICMGKIFCDPQLSQSQELGGWGVVITTYATEKLWHVFQKMVNENEILMGNIATHIILKHSCKRVFLSSSAVLIIGTLPKPYGTGYLWHVTFSNILCWRVIVPYLPMAAIKVHTFFVIFLHISESLSVHLIIPQSVYLSILKDITILTL